MGVSMMSALVIASGPVEVLVNGPDENGQYQGHICHSKDHPHHPYLTILSSQFCFESVEVAEKKMNEVIKEVTDYIDKEMATPEKEEI